MPPINEKLLSPQERDAIAYFQGKDCYKTYQKLETEPNIFDTKETFHLKMNNCFTRDKFINSLNRSKLKSKLPDKN